MTAIGPSFGKSAGCRTIDDIGFHLLRFSLDFNSWAIRHGVARSLDVTLRDGVFITLHENLPAIPSSTSAFDFEHPRRAEIVIGLWVDDLNHSDFCFFAEENPDFYKSDNAGQDFESTSQVVTTYGPGQAPAVLSRCKAAVISRLSEDEAYSFAEYVMGGGGAFNHSPSPEL